MAADGDAPVAVDDVPTAKVDESRAALVALIAGNPEKAADVILTCRDLVLSFDDRLRESEARIVRAEKLALEAIAKAERLS